MPDSESLGFWRAIDPIKRGFNLVGGELAEIRLDEMSGDARQGAEETAVRDKCDARDLAVVVADEFEVGAETGEILPSGKLVGLDHESLERVALLDPVIDLGGEVREVVCGDGAGRGKNKDTSVGELIGNHGFSS